MLLLQLVKKAHLFCHIHAQHRIKEQNGIIFSNDAIMSADYSNLYIPNLTDIDFLALLIFISRSGYTDAFGDAGTKFRWSYYFGMTSVAEYQTLQLIVDYHFERELDRSVSEALLHFLRFMKWL